MIAGAFPVRERSRAPLASAFQAIRLLESIKDDRPQGSLPEIGDGFNEQKNSDYGVRFDFYQPVR